MEQKGKKPFECSVCHVNFSTNFRLTKHRKVVQEGLKPEKCQICDALFSCKGNLLSHTERMHKEAINL